MGGGGALCQNVYPCLFSAFLSDDWKLSSNLPILFNIIAIYKKLINKGYGRMKKVTIISRSYDLEI